MPWRRQVVNSSRPDGGGMVQSRTGAAIVMGNKGESFVEEVVTGSVAHAVLRLSPLPVTYVK